MNIFNVKIDLILKSLKKEYTLIEEIYSEEKIFQKSLPIKVSKKCNVEQKNDVQKLINSIFIPTFSTVSKMIDNGLVELSTISDKTDINKFDKDDKITEKLVYESWDKLYINKYIKYNIIISFIMQLYLIFEKELVFYTKNEYKNEFSGKTLFSAITFLESNLNSTFSSQTKDSLNIYRNVINVHKHGKGDSYYEIKKRYSNYINENIEPTNLDTTFLFNLEKINFNNLYNTIIELLEQIK